MLAGVGIKLGPNASRRRVIVSILNSVVVNLYCGSVRLCNPVLVIVSSSSGSLNFLIIVRCLFLFFCSVECCLLLLRVCVLCSNLVRE